MRIEQISRNTESRHVSTDRVELRAMVVRMVTFFETATPEEIKNLGKKRKKS